MQQTNGFAATEGADVFPFHHKHNHSPSLAVLPDKSLLLVFYRGSGERTADDVAIWACRKSRDGVWSSPVIVADTEGFPDTNPVVTVAPNGDILLFYGTQIDNNWESTLLKQRVGRIIGSTGCNIKWTQDRVILLKPNEELFKAHYLKGLQSVYRGAQPADLFPKYYAIQEERATKRLNYRLGWMGRTTPQWVGNRCYIGLYHDGFDVGLVAWTSDNGATIACGSPIVGRAAIQPSLLRLKDSSWVAYNRNNGPGPMRILSSRSVDDCVTWTLATEMALPNPGTSVAVDRLKNDTIVLVGNDTEDGRHSLALWSSDNEGKTWSSPVTIESAAEGSDWSFHYPSLIRLPSGDLGLAYSRYAKAGQTMRYVVIGKQHLP